MSSLVDELGILLRALGIPLLLESPADLTPSLLLAILECILSSRLPLSPEIRDGLSSKSKDADHAKIQCMKIFLGIIETDILKKDVGMGGIDPLKLANGDWDEVVYVGEILCWIGRDMGITDGILGRKDARELQAWRLTPYTLPETSISQFSLSSLPTADTSASLHDIDHLRSFQAPSISSRLSPLVLPLPRRPQCIHEVQFPYTRDVSAIGSESQPVRYSGFIQSADEDAEINSFESHRSSRKFISGSDSDVNDESEDEWELSSFYPLSDSDPQTRTISLLQQRAFLLHELAKYHEGD
ncbi:hypothetical protein GYMLUDRAFT_73937 [Collybiopsis luxurians FD-317 M1]|uniref:Unplaced genomic scaffold GYMLUscaffold_27, whole genome shotgun sequence n=1 Tax=Collybiopsis luxurians FD-317 M1 TaxID=944289 RepID=A0A0D0BA09_9AGAR|nr:hypothetical protein GYMLUDRAFT_73937 [Collybiopsis luxurians FD-317 M1]